MRALSPPGKRMRPLTRLIFVATSGCAPAALLSASKCAPLAAAGALVASSAAEVASSADVTFAMLSDPRAACAVADAAAKVSSQTCLPPAQQT